MATKRSNTGRGSTGRGSTGRGSTGRGSTGRGSTGRGSKGACGGSRRRDGSGGGKGNINTPRQPRKK